LPAPRAAGGNPRETLPEFIAGQRAGKRRIFCGHVISHGFSLARDALHGYDREDLVLNLRYAPEAAGRVAEMVRKEQACCAFLTFAIHENHDQVRLTITAPEQARAIADALFEPFIAAPQEQGPFPAWRER
jgi:hypothetical protein